ncbi:MAG: hypothetical protein KDC95_13405 [Planctomycetes bacterium]|nr:hypothetical protein [Planctomycetota bacterium]
MSSRPTLSALSALCLRAIAGAAIACGMSSCSKATSDRTLLGVGAAPANSWAAITWDEAMPSGVRTALERLPLAGAQAMFSAGAGRGALLAPFDRKAERRLVASAIVRTAGDRHRAIAEALPESYRLEKDASGAGRDDAYAITPRQWSDSYEPPKATLDGEAWFQSLAHAFPLPKSTGARPRGVGVLGVCDLAEARAMIVDAPEGILRFLQHVPGMTSFRSLGLRLTASGTDDADIDIALASVLARTPVGIAKALAVEPAKLRLEPAMRRVLRREDPTLAMILRVDPGVLIDSAGAAFGISAGLGLDVNPVEALRTLRLGKVLTRAFWNTLDREWGIIARQRGGRLDICAVATVLDRNELIAGLTEMTGAAPQPLSEDGSVLAFERRMMGFSWKVLLGRDRAALATGGAGELALDFVGMKARDEPAPALVANGWLDFRPGALPAFDAAIGSRRVEGTLEYSQAALIFSGRASR